MTEQISSADAGPPTGWRRWLPSGTEWVVLLLAIGMPLGYGRVWLSLDGDPGRHIRVGETILRSGLFYHDPFSFTKFGAPFVPYEWLSEVLFALSVRVAGLPGILALTGLVLALTYALVTRTMLRRGVSPLLTAFTLLLILSVGIVHWHARPHIFTLLAAAVLMLLIDRADARHGPITTGRELWSVAWPTVALFAFWVNLHGGFLYGFFLLGAVTVGDRLEMLAATSDSDRERWKGALIRHATMFGVALVAGLINPTGPSVYAHTVGYLRDRYLVDHTSEYTAPDFHILRSAAVVIVLVVFVLSTLPRRPRYPTVAIVALNLGFALFSARNLPLFAIVVLPLVAAEAQRSIEKGWRFAPLFAQLSVAARQRAARLRPLWPIAAGLVMLAAARHADRTGPDTSTEARYAHTLLPTTFNPDKFPVVAVRTARAAGMNGRLLSDFIWGGYVLYAWPEQKVFIDGQTDFYGDSLMQAYIQLALLAPGWRATLAHWNIELALLSTNSPLADAIAHEPGWQPVYCDSTAILFRRTESTVPAVAPLASLSCAGLSIVSLPAIAGSDAEQPARLAATPISTQPPEAHDQRPSN